MGGCSFVAEADATSSGFMLSDGDILIGLTGYVGEVAKVRGFDALVLNQRVGKFFPSERCDLDFLFFLVSNDDFRQRVEASSHGSAQANVSPSAIEALEVMTPPLPEQRMIAATLGALDDKIDLNRRMNETLEAMARAIFKDWFVDFGPTRAKMEGREPYIAPEIWDLFPDRLDEEGKPEGWEELSLGALGEITIGGLWGKDEPENADFDAYMCLRGVDIQHLREQGTAPKAPWRFAKRVAIAKRTISTCDVLIASSGVGPCGRSLWVGVEDFFSRKGQTIYSNFVKRIVCKTPGHACFVDRHLHRMKLNGEIQKFISGTSVPNLNGKGLMDSHRLVVAPVPVLEAFLSFSMMLQKRLFSGESRTLAQTRDLLLPNLMSGEIRVKDAETFLGRVP